MSPLLPAADAHGNIIKLVSLVSKSAAAVLTDTSTANYDVIHYARHFETICVLENLAKGGP